MFSEDIVLLASSNAWSAEAIAKVKKTQEQKLLQLELKALLCGVLYILIYCSTYKII